MPHESEQFLKSEQAAHDLLAALKTLKEEAVSYKTSTQELETARRQLINLIDAVQALANGAGEVVGSLKEIGSPQILHSIEMLSKKIEEESAKQQLRLTQVKIVATASAVLAALTFIGLLILFLK